MLKFLVLILGLMSSSVFPMTISKLSTPPMFSVVVSGEIEMLEALIYLDSLLGLPYQYGGNGNPGYDCSGVVVEFLKATGEVPYNYDNTAQGLYHKYESSGRREVNADWKMIGALAFYGKDIKHISHIGIVRNPYLIVEAGGGNASTDTIEEAWEREARVRMRPIKYRKDFIVMIKPHFKALGMGRFF